MNLPIVLVRFSEIALKSKKTRALLRKLLRENIFSRLKMDGLRHSRIEDTWERLIVYTDDSEEVANAISKVFGVISTSPAIECKADIDEITRIVCDLAREKLLSGESFAIRVRRVGKHEFRSNEVARSVGSSVIETLNRENTVARVNLDSPDHEFSIEIRGERSFIYDSTTRGVGGLPLGSQGKIVVHLSDPESIMVAWLMMKRGCTPILAAFDSKEEIRELKNLTRSSLSPYTSGKLQLIEVTLGDLTSQNDPAAFRKALEFMTMNEIAAMEGAEGIATSDQLDPSSPQEIAMSWRYRSFVNCPIYYPLVGFDRDYIRCLAEKIGGRQLAERVTVQQTGRTTERNYEYNNREAELFMKGYQEKVRKVLADARRRLLST